MGDVCTPFIHPSLFSHHFLEVRFFPAELNQLNHGYHRMVHMLLTHLHLETPQILSRLCNCCYLCPHRFAEEYKKEPNRGYGMAVVNVFKKLLSPKCSDVFEPARAQFNGKGSYGNGGAMRVAGIPLTYSDVQDVKKVLFWAHWGTLAL